MDAKSKDKTPTLEDVSVQLEVLRADVAALTRLLGDVGKARVDMAAEDLRARADHLRAEGRRYAHRAEESADAALDVVRHQPVTAIAIAVGLGFLFGLAASRR
jgi:ElaB/YqjD/DUF883 family membrane-anchored ribosome-binding protein